MSKWIETYSGKRFDFTSPAENEYHIVDIAHALSRLCRFGGHVKGDAYSVAEHSVQMSRAVEGLPAQVACLLHDGSEAYLGDVVSPLKNLLPMYQQIEDEIQAQVYEVLGMGVPDPDTMAIVHCCDMGALKTEAKNLLVTQGRSWIDGIDVPPLAFVPQCWCAKRAEDEFIQRYLDLQGV